MTPEESLQIPLDPSIHVWVLLPITIATLLMSLVRRNLRSIVQSAPRVSLSNIRLSSRLRRASMLRLNSHNLSSPQFEARRRYFLHPDTGLKSSKKSHSPLTALMDPESMANHVVSMLITVLPHMFLGTWARYVFAGLIVCRLPFTLSPRFRPMLQSSLDLVASNLDVSYVSSLSWYILNLFGNAGLLSLFSDDQSDDVFVPSITSQISMNISPDSLCDKERRTLSNFVHVCRLSEVEQALLDVDPAQFAAF